MVGTSQLSASEQAFYVKNGFVLLKSLFSAERAAQLAEQATAEAKITPTEVVTEADATNRFHVALQALTSAELTWRVRGVMGEDVKFLQLSDLRQNHNSWSWHRDSAHREFGIGQDFDERDERYDVSKLIVYLHADAFGLALIAGSHRNDVRPGDEHTDFSAAVSVTPELVAQGAELQPGTLVRISPNAGDAILFDERLLHCGRPHDDSGFTASLTTRKMTLCWVFGHEGRHARRFHSYFRFVRANYEPLSEVVRSRLAAAALLPSSLDANYFHDAPDEVEGVFFPEPVRQSEQVRAYGLTLATELRRVYENNRELASLQGRHEGQTVYVVGSGPSLNGFAPEWLEELERCPSVGLNRSTYIVRTPYFLSAYISENLLARMRNPATTCLHVRPSVTLPLAEGIYTAKRNYTETPDAVTREWSIDEPALCTRKNAMFAATHLALILGASNICYVGVEQRNRLHYYNTNSEIHQQMFQDLLKLIATQGDLLGLDHPYEFPYEIMRRHFESPRELANDAFYELDHTELLGRWFEHMDRKLDAGAISSVDDSVACDAGAVHLPLAHVLEEGWRRDCSRIQNSRGFVDAIELTSDHVRVAGWAVDLERREPCSEILLMAGDILVARTPVDGAREDVARHLGNPSFTNCGFDATLPWDPKPARDPKSRFERRDLRAYGKRPDGKLFRLAEGA